MCEYEKNIEAAIRPWVAGTVVRHLNSGSLYTILSDGGFFAHAEQKTLEYVVADDYNAISRITNFEVVS